MQTIYYTTTHFVRHTGNVVDLEEYRRKLALTREGNLAPLPEEREEPEAPRLHLVAVQDRRAGTPTGRPAGLGRWIFVPAWACSS